MSWIPGPGISVPYATPEKVRAAVKAGFQVIRLLNDSGPENTAYSMVEAHELGVKVILDFCHLPGSPKPEAWKILERVEMARRVAPAHAAIEIVNEPRYKQSVEVYDKILALAIASIREVTDVPIIISNPHLGDPDYWDGPLLKWTPPKGKNLIASMHYYRPFAVTHPELYRNPGTNVKALAPGEGSKFDRDDWGNLDLHIRRFAAWCELHGLEPLIGEAGCHQHVPNRTEWFHRVSNLAAVHGVPVCWWAWNDVFGLKDGMPDRAQVLKEMISPDMNGW